MGIPGITDRLKIRDRRVEVRGGGGCLPIIGVPLLVFGCAPVVVVIVGAWVPREVIEFLVVPLVGLCLIAAGLLLIFGRLRVDVDGNSRTYRRQFSVLITIKETSGSLDEFDRVNVHCENRRTTSGSDLPQSHTVYPIRLIGASTSFEIWKASNLNQARNQAEQIAKALGFPLVDRTISEAVVREANHLDEPLRQQRRRTGVSLGGLPRLPKGMKTQVRIEGRELVLEIPPVGAPSLAVSAMACAVAFLFVGFGSGGMLFVLKQFPKRPDLFEWVFYSVFLLFLAFFILLSICGAAKFFLDSFCSYTVRVSPDRLHLTAHWGPFSRVSEMSADELEELHLKWSESPPTQMAYIVARSDRKTLIFSGLFSVKEANWIKKALEDVLTT